MIKVFFLILRPDRAWERIASERRGYAYICATYLLPLLILLSLAEGWGLQHWGKWESRFQVFKDFTPHEVLVFETAQFVVSLASVWVSALLILQVSQTFRDRIKYLQAFTLAAYGFCPIFLVHFFDIAPSMNPWATWAAGVGVMVWILYQGVPRVLQTDPTHAFGVYLSTVFIMVLTSALARLFTGLYLLGYVDFQHSWLTRELSRLLGQ